MKKLLILLFLLIPSVVWGAPSNTMSITPAAVDANVIEASDENTRNSEISTKYNAHSHEDITQVGNTLKVGDGTAGNKTIQANNADVSKPFVRFDDTNDRWVVSGDGTNVESIVVMTGAAVDSYVLPGDPEPFEFMVYGEDGVWDANRTSPAFQVAPTNEQSNIALATTTTVVLDAETFDIGGNFSANTFTAPVGGRYYLSVRIRLDDMDNAATVIYDIRLVTSNRSYAYLIEGDNQFSADLDNSGWAFSVVADMDKNDTAYITVRQDNGTQQMDVSQDAIGTTFSGFLIP